MNTTSNFLLFVCLAAALFGACSPAPATVPTVVPATATPPLPTPTVKPPTATLQPTPVSPSPTATSRPPTLTPKPMTKPDPTNYYEGVYDPTTQRLILVNNLPSDVWAYDFTAKKWTRLADHPLQWVTNVLYEPNAGRVIAYSKLTGQTFSYDPVQNHWQGLSTGPSNMATDGGSPMAYDTKAGKIIMLSKGSSEAHKSETWAFDYDTNTWSQMKPGANDPEYKALAMSYDAESDRMILWDGNPVKRVWAYDASANTWEEIPYTKGPTQGDMLDSSVYVPDLDRVYFYYLDQFYAYDYNTKSWEKAKGELKPGPRFLSSLVYDPVTKHIVLYGGVNPYIYDDIWFYDPRSGVWTEEKQT